MTRLGILTALFIGAFAASFAPAAADPVGADQIIACRATGADVASVAVDDLRFGVEASYAWANAKIHLTMRDQTVREYVLSGRADPIDKPAKPNNARAGFTYPGFTCMVQYPSIISVRNCAGANKRRSCEIGVSFFGMPLVYAVSMTAQRSRIVEASSVP
jgi:hypothetical protein